MRYLKITKLEIMGKYDKELLITVPFQYVIDYLKNKVQKRLKNLAYRFEINPNLRDLRIKQ